MAITDAKFSTFSDGGDLVVDDIVVGLRDGVNTRFSYTGAVGVFLPLAGGTMAGDIDMDGFQITGLPAPVGLTDATNKEYVDDEIAAATAGAALTRVNDTNVTLALGGSPATALVNAASLTLSWSGELAVPRGGTGLAALTDHYLMIGNGVDPLTLLAPNATSGIPLISQGAASDPTYGTSVVAGGGTGNTTFTAYSVICAGTTATGAFQNVVGVGAVGEALISNGAGLLPSWQSIPGGGTVSAGLINELAWYSAAGTTVSGLTTANSAALVTSATGVPTWLGAMTDGQIVIGSTGATPVRASITAGANITVTPGAGTITIASTASGGLEQSILLMGG